MTVKELIEILNKAAQDKEVKIMDSNGDIVEDIFTIDQDDENVNIIFD